MVSHSDFSDFRHGLCRILGVFSCKIRPVAGGTPDNRGIPNPSNRFIRNFMLKKVCLRCIFLKTLCCNPIVWGSRCLTPRQKNPKHPISTLFGTFSLLCTGTSHITHFTAHLQTQQSTSGTVTFACRLNRPW